MVSPIGTKEIDHRSQIQAHNRLSRKGETKDRGAVIYDVNLARSAKPAGSIL